MRFIDGNRSFELASKLLFWAGLGIMHSFSIVSQKFTVKINQ